MTAPCLAEDIYLKYDGPYGRFLKYVQRSVRHWNPSITDTEIQNYCVSTWNGCDGKIEECKRYYFICLKEQGMRNRDLFDRGGGYGYSGANSRVVYRATFGKSRKWVRLHPYTTNEALAWWFCKRLKSIPVCWYSNPDQGKMQDYEDDINFIRDYCDQQSGEITDLKPMYMAHVRKRN